MSMTPIVTRVAGKGPFTFLLAKADLDSLLDTAALGIAFLPQTFTTREARTHPGWTAGGGYAAFTKKLWANMLRDQANFVPEQVRAVCAAALVGGGMAAGPAADVANTLARHQIDRDVDLLTAQVVLAAIAAG